MSGDAERLDAPNQQVVRPDASGPSDEGEGGSQREEDASAEASSQPADEYEDMTKDELLSLAQERGISPANASMTKAELQEALRS